jgi:hypothetical protein
LATVPELHKKRSTVFTDLGKSEVLYTEKANVWCFAFVWSGGKHKDDFGHPHGSVIILAKRVCATRPADKGKTPYQAGMIWIHLVGELKFHLEFAF